MGHCWLFERLDAFADEQGQETIVIGAEIFSQVDGQYLKFAFEVFDSIRLTGRSRCPSRKKLRRVGKQFGKPQRPFADYPGDLYPRLIRKRSGEHSCLRRVSRAIADTHCNSWRRAQMMLRITCLCSAARPGQYTADYAV